MNGSSNDDHGKEKHQKMIELAAFILCLALTVQADANWEAVTKEVRINANLQQDQLQIMTSFRRGSYKSVFLYFYGDRHWGLAGGVTIWFSSPIKYWISYCKNEYLPFPTTPPTDQHKVWSIHRTKIGLKIECNGILLVEYNTSQCQPVMWRNEVRQIIFDSSDTASKKYRVLAPGSDNTAYFYIVKENGVIGGNSGLLLYNGGTVCDDGFDKNAADAICFHLGYQTGGSEWTSGLSWDVQDRYNIALDDVICKNTSWSSCSYAKSSDCTHSEDVFLTCSRQEGQDEVTNFDILDENGVGGGSSGLLLYNGGTVCNDGFDEIAANSVCAFLGYDIHGSSPSQWTTGNSWDIQEEYEITLDNVICKNISWSSCSYSTESHDCTHLEDVFLTCNTPSEEKQDSEQATYFDIVELVGQQVVGGGSSGLLLYNGGTVCDDGFDKNAADAICSHLGYYNTTWSEWSVGHSWDIQNGYNITLDNVLCKNNSWSSCTYNTKSSDCTHAEDVFLSCTRPEDGERETYFDIVELVGQRVVGGGSSGLLLYNGGTVCDDGFDKNAADAICSYLGYYNTTSSEWSIGNIWDIQNGYNITLDNVICKNNSWSSCTYNTKSSDCTHAEDVFLSCTRPEGRLAIGKKSNTLIIGIMAAVLGVSLFMGCLLYRKYRQKRVSQRNEHWQPMAYHVVPEGHPSDTIQEEPGTAAAATFNPGPAFNDLDIFPPSYTEAVGGHNEGKAPSYDEAFGTDFVYREK